MENDRAPHRPAAVFGPLESLGLVEGVAHLAQVPETGCLVTIGDPRLKGGLGGYPRYVAVCPADWQYGVSVGQVAEAPLPRHDKILQWDTAQGVRVRK